jgi:acetamidase/formamidase
LAAEYALKASLNTVHWGHFSSKLNPVLTIDCGDTVTFEVMPSLIPDFYVTGGIPAEQIPQELYEIHKEVKDRGPGSHILVGPIYINGAEPGDMLEVQIKSVEITRPFGCNLNRPGMGLLPEDFPFEAVRILKLDLKNMISSVLPSLVIPLRPFFGVMGVAPPLSMGKISSLPPGIHGGNMDNKELIAGTILYLPVHVKGALFSCGDGHAVQGDGEVNITALETFLKGTFQFFVRKGKRILWPRAETSTHFITFGLHEDLNIAAKKAIIDMIDYLHEEKGISREYAYMIASLIVDLHVTQCVASVKSVHAMLPKSIFIKG